MNHPATIKFTLNEQTLAGIPEIQSDQPIERVNRLENNSFQPALEWECLVEVEVLMQLLSIIKIMKEIKQIIIK